jgi:dihydropteroate synthase
MGVVNVTPDSFYAGGRSATTAEAVDAALRQAEEGADILDIGGQSTRPGSLPVPQDEELGRVLPVLEALARRLDVPLSIDTDKAEVARRALEAGASIVNDVSALRNDPFMLEAALKAEAVILMHRGGCSPKDMQERPVYGDVVAQVKDFLRERKEFFARSGGDAARLLVDVGIGFGKDLDHNLSLLRHIDEFAQIAPLVLGVSRKSFLGRVIAGPGGEIPGPEERLEGSLAAACWAALKGVKALRVHDVGATARALRTFDAIMTAR